MKQAGIYKIARIGTDQCYVGSSYWVGKRWATHRPEVLAARSAGLTPEIRERMGAGSRGKPQSAEHRAKRLAALRAYHDERRRNAALV